MKPEPHKHGAAGQFSLVFEEKSSGRHGRWEDRLAGMLRLAEKISRARHERATLQLEEELRPSPSRLQKS